MLAQSPRIARPVLAALFDRADAARWGLTASTFQAAIEASVAHRFGDRPAQADEIDRFLSSLHVADLALAAACAAGHDAAWESFIRDYRPVLHRAADAIDPGGGARELADALYADLYGLRETGGVRQSLFRYYHGRSSLATWLRAVLSQRFVDRVRAGRRVTTLPDEDDPPAAAPSKPVAPDIERPRFVDAVGSALAAALAALAPRDRLRLGCYYVQRLTLAQIGRMLGEHEASASRHLTRARAEIRETMERHLREQERMSDAEIAGCFQSAADDPGAIDLAALVGELPAGKNDGRRRSKE